MTDVPRFQTPADAPSLIYGADFTTPETRRYEEASRNRSLRRTESVASIFGAIHGSSVSTPEQSTAQRRHSFNLGHPHVTPAQDLGDNFSSSVQRSLFAVTPQRSKASPIDCATPNMFEPSTLKTSEPSSVWSTDKGISALDIDLIYKNKEAAAELTCVATVRSDSSHPMKGTLTSVEEGNGDLWKTFEQKLSGCPSSLDSNVDSVLTWNNVSLDLFDGFSPYVDVGKSEWPSSNAAGSFASDPHFTPRDTGSANILGNLLDSATIASGPSTISCPNTTSPNYLDSGEDDPMSSGAFSPLQTEESFGARSAF
eukprot:gene29237-36251_t